MIYTLCDWLRSYGWSITSLYTRMDGKYTWSNWMMFYGVLYIGSSPSYVKPRAMAINEIVIDLQP
jgi:hypothetical protein